MFGKVRDDLTNIAKESKFRTVASGREKEKLHIGPLGGAEKDLNIIALVSIIRFTYTNYMIASA
jgi:hypothetical protein